MVEERAHEVTHQAATAIQEVAHETAQGASQEGLKELANWITLVNEHSHGSLAHFLHHWENVIFWIASIILLLIIIYLFVSGRAFK